MTAWIASANSGGSPSKHVHGLGADDERGKKERCDGDADGIHPPQQGHQDAAKAISARDARL